MRASSWARVPRAGARSVGLWSFSCRLS